MILCYLLIFLFFNLIKTAAKFMRTESVKCPVRAVFAKLRARHVHIMSLNLLTSQKSTDLNYSISRVSSMFTSLGLPMNHYTISFFLQKTKTLSLALPTSNSCEYCTQELKPLDISYDQIFLQRSTQTLKYIDEFPE